MATVGVLVTIGLASGRSGPATRMAKGVTSDQSSSPASPPRPAAQAIGEGSGASTFEVLDEGWNEVGEHPRRGYAFVVRTGTSTSDLLTDYELVCQQYLEGQQTVQLRRGDQRFTATIIAASPDPHVALLRISGSYPSLLIAPHAPGVGDSVTLGEIGFPTTRRGAVVAYAGRGSPRHLTFSLAVDRTEDGAPVLDDAHRVVGIAEPTAPFDAPGLGFALPIHAACSAVGAC